MLYLKPNCTKLAKYTYVEKMPYVPVVTIFEISRYMYTRNALLIRLLKILRQPTTGFALLGAHQGKHHKREIQLGSK
ncbi:hypothetical protein CSKR_104298 [Clonorchis sinensis]|uniref:Uncharacterized protein n=1 Tax=Clonorchis sinensis TaxID=79923 RepID=A0A3R7CHM0_CLOSI|nr:hypothetical protein CSKR_104298 [Clonorchis sinensis]